MAISILGHFLTSLLLAPAANTPAEDVTLIRAAVEKSLPFLEREGVRWAREEKCASCHQVPSYLWATRAARAQGFDVHADALDEWTNWATSRALEASPETQVDTIVHLLNGEPPRARELADHLITARTKRCTFEAQGQLPDQLRDEKETDVVTTLWAALALAKTRRADGRMTFGAVNQERGKTTEWLVAHTLCRREYCEPSSEDPCIDRLIAEQNDDGGWGWTKDHASDALATGQALLALGRTTDARERRAVRRAYWFLASTQCEDGSWKVPSTLASKRGEAVPTSNFWGTAWAVIGIAGSLPLEGAAVAVDDSVPTHYRGRKIGAVSRNGESLLRQSREAEQRGSLLLAALRVPRDATVCDLGSGNGYFTLDLARLVGPRGKVCAVDLQPKFLAEIDRRAERAGLSNIDTHLGTPTDPELGTASFDLVLIVDAYHEFSHPEEMMASVRRALRPDGRLAIVEYRAKGEPGAKTSADPSHTMTRERILAEIEPLGFRHVESFDGLPVQHLLFFERADLPPR